MTLESISEQVNTLRDNPVTRSATPALQDTVQDVWRTHVLTKLSEILDSSSVLSEEDRIDALKSFLEDSWSMIKGTSVSYTACPDSDITGLMISIAEDIDATNPLSLLMPGVSLESMYDKSEAGYVDYPNLDTQNLSAESIQDILETHVLGHDAAYLCPVKLLTALPLIPEDKEPPYRNPYWDDINHPENAHHLAKEEYGRIESHSALTEAVIDAKKHYDSVSQDKSNLLGQLRLLLQHLALNSAGARGEEDSAGGGAYPAILNFRDYYTTLPEEEKVKIPKELKAEIDKLLDFAFNKKSNINATETIETCLNIRRGQITQALTGHDEALSQISIGHEQQAGLIKEARERFESATKNLLEAINNKTYHEGSDKLGITQKLLKTLGVQINITSPTDLELVRSLSPDEINEVLQDKRLKQEIMAQLSSLENIVIFIMETPADKLRVFLSNLQDEIAPLIKDSSDLAVLLISLDMEKTQATVSALKHTLLQLLIKGGIYKINEHISSEQQALIDKALAFDEIKNDLRGMIESAEDFGLVMDFLSPEQRVIFFERMKKDLSGMIQSASDFSYVMTFLSPEQRVIFFERMEKDLSGMIQSAWDFSYVMDLLSPEQRVIFFEHMEKDLSGMIQSASDFNYVMTFLSPEQRVIFFERMEKDLSGMIQSALDFSYVMTFLSPEQRVIFFERMEKDLSGMIDSASDFNYVMTFLSPEQRTAVYESMNMKKSLSETIESGGDFRAVLEHLTEEQRTAVYESMKKSLPGIIKSGWDLGAALEYLTPAQCTAVIEGMEDSLPEIIKSAYDFRAVLRYLTSAQCTAVIEGMKGSLKSGGDLGAVLEHLTEEQRTAVIEGMKGSLPGIIKSGWDLGAVLKHLTPAQCTAVIEDMKGSLPGIIKSGWDLGAALKRLTPAQCTAVIEGMKGSLPGIIKSGEDFGAVLERLTEEQRTAVIEGMQDEVADMIIQESIQSASKWQQLKNAVYGTMFLSWQITEAFFEQLRPQPSEEEPILNGTSLAFLDVEEALNKVTRHLQPEAKRLLQEAVNKKLQPSTETFKGRLEGIKPSPESESGPESDSPNRRT